MVGATECDPGRASGFAVGIRHVVWRLGLPSPVADLYVECDLGAWKNSQSFVPGSAARGRARPQTSCSQCLRDLAIQRATPSKALSARASCGPKRL